MEERQESSIVCRMERYYKACTIRGLSKQLPVPTKLERHAVPLDLPRHEDPDILAVFTGKTTRMLFFITNALGSLLLSFSNPPLLEVDVSADNQGQY